MFIKRSPIPRAIVASRQCHRLSSIARTHVCRRAYATVAKASTSATPFTVSEISGVKVAARDDGGPTTGLSIVLRAGSRYCPLPGVAHLLAKFAWKVI
jgi:ubiquinol-cytochrome c reductase core subunit 2